MQSKPNLPQQTEPHVRAYQHIALFNVEPIVNSTLTHLATYLDSLELPHLFELGGVGVTFN